MTPLIETQALHYRKTAEGVLLNDHMLPRYVSPETLPIAGLRAYPTETESGCAFTPIEMLSDTVRPVMIIDLDDTVWEHVRHVVTAVSEATGIHVSWDEFLDYGHTRKIPVWKDNAKAMEIHDQIQRGEHENYFPFVNRAWPRAIDAIEAVHCMGHEYSYLTARSPRLFSATLRVMAWNNIPHDHQHTLIDAKHHTYPQTGVLYCAHSALSDVNQYKFEVVKQWSENLRGKGRTGPIVVIDDLLKPYQPLVESGDVVGISLSGPLNKLMKPYPREHRVESWDEIGELLMDVHRHAVAADPSPYRLFDCHPTLENTLLVASKDECGTGEFTLADKQRWGLITRDQWREDKEAVLRKMGIT